MGSRNAWKRTVRITAKFLLSFGIFCVVVAASHHPHRRGGDVREGVYADAGLVQIFWLLKNKNSINKLA